MKTLCFITDPLVTTAGSVRPALLLAEVFAKKGYDITLVTTRSDKIIRSRLRRDNVLIKEIGPHRSILSTLPTLDAWGRCLLVHKTTNETYHSDLSINTSSCIIGQAHAYYAQGPMTKTLDDLLPNIPLSYRYPYRFLRSPLRILEQGLIKEFRNSSNIFVANSLFCASMYNEYGTKVDRIINPPLDCSMFRPTTPKPAEDYVLTHLGTQGKEGRFSTIRAIADAGVLIKIFGDTSSVPRILKNHHNLRFIGRVTDRELTEFYSNALYTLFAFEHEPFGYIPIESMSCETPVLTYRKQGPSETVIDRKTGWLFNTEQDLIASAVRLWKEGYSSGMRKECRKRALNFDVNRIAEEWSEILDLAESSSCRPPGGNRLSDATRR